MPHQAHGIRWDALSENLKYRSADLYKGGGTPCDLVWQFKPNQGKDIAHFAESFVRNLDDHTKTQRKQYPAEYEPPNRDEVIIDERLARKITPVIMQAREKGTWDARLCPHQDDISEALRKDDPRRRQVQTDDMEYACSCALPFKERRAAAFLRGYVQNDCYQFYNTNGAAYLNLKVMMALLLYGEMDPILRICSHPEADYANWRDQRLCYDVSLYVGWNWLYKRALDAYLGLNIIDCFPELWDPGSGCRRQDDRSAQDLEIADEYRNTAFYQRVLYSATKDSVAVIPTIPHQQFFGDSGDDHSSFNIKLAHRWPALTKLTEGKKLSRRNMLVDSNPDEFPFGLVPFDVSMNCQDGERPYLVSADDIAQVREVLYEKGLPMELVLHIMDFAGLKTPQRRLLIANDPFHPANREDLDKYMRFCWLTLVRCNMLAQASGCDINWKAEIFNRLDEFVGTPPGRKLCKREYEWDEDGREWLIYHFLTGKGKGNSVKTYSV
ncbi:hypothetical protein BDV18DRAFT_140788 [Aspergillus unguis]